VCYFPYYTSLKEAYTNSKRDKDNEMFQKWEMVSDDKAAVTDLEHCPNFVAV
jgi:hypothetical protein